VKAAVVRQASSVDWPKIRELCCLTGDAGAPIGRDRWRFFAENWIGPYQKLSPEWGFVADAGGGKIVGYLTGCADTRAFSRASRILFEPKLAVAILIGRYEKTVDTQRFLRRTLRLEQGPDRSFSKELAARFTSDYPAHLHINLDASARGQGLGRKLLDSFFNALRARHVRGVHVYCGEGPVPFYKAAGFDVLEQIEFRGAPVFAMGKLLV
jgi:GNAT superfamily N-acetyltransferase